MPNKSSRIARRNFTVVTYDEDGSPQVDYYYAGDEIDDEVAAMIDNKSIFEGEERHSPGNPEERAAARDAEDEANPVASPGHHAGERRAAAASNNPARLRDADDDELDGSGHGSGELEGRLAEGGLRGKLKENKKDKGQASTGLNAMTVQELIQLLNDNGVEVPANGRKADLVASAEAAGLTAPGNE